MLDLKGADLNLLVSLDALIEEANVTKAAERWFRRRAGEG
jgi:hypothetical protein